MNLGEEQNQELRIMNYEYREKIAFWLKILLFLLPLATSYYLLAPSPARASELSYIHSDHLGSTSLVTDEQGNVVSQQVYYPYGATRQKLKAEGLKLTAREYTGQVSDQDQTGLYYYNARYYNPAIAIFTQADIVQGLNRYFYVSNNPIVRTDPSGHMDQAEGGGGYMHTKPKQGIWIGETYYANGYPGCSTGAGWALPGNCGAPSYPQAPSVADTLLVMGATSGGLGMAWAVTPTGYVFFSELFNGAPITNYDKARQQSELSSLRQNILGKISSQTGTTTMDEINPVLDRLIAEGMDPIEAHALVLNKITPPHSWSLPAGDPRRMNSTPLISDIQDYVNNPARYLDAHISCESAICTQQSNLVSYVLSERGVPHSIYEVTWENKMAHQFVAVTDTAGLVRVLDPNLPYSIPLQQYYQMNSVNYGGVVREIISGQQ